jgi:hypothetical protein
MPARKNVKTAVPKTTKPAVAKDRSPKKLPAKLAAKLPDSMITGKASPAKAADGDQPVFDYIASLPQPQRGIAEKVDALAAKTLPGLQRSVKWGMSYYGVGDGWCFCCGGFANHVKLMFVNGATLTPVPPVTPQAMGKATRGVELVSLKELDERQVAAWMKQIVALPGVGGKKRTPLNQSKVESTVHPDIAAYNQNLAGSDQEISNLLVSEIERELTKAESKIWHSHPVWFLDGNPIVGYSKQKLGMRLMFWSGADFQEPGLNVIGKKFKDASIFFNDPAEINTKVLRRWLKESKLVQWDYKNIVKRKGKLIRLE